MKLSFVTIAVAVGSAAAAASPKFSAFTSKACSGSSIGVKSVKNLGTGVNCFTLDKAAHSFDADTDGCIFESLTGAGCTGTEGLLEQGSCDTGLSAFKSVRQGCS